jgi:hypothetical protein
MARGLRETIASFTGGRVVTVGEAAANEALQTAFFTQTKILEDMYGLDQQSSARTLEFLKDLENATAMGDDDAAAKAAEQIQEAVQNRVETTDQLDILNTQTAALLADSLIQTKHLGLMTRLMAAGIQEEAAGAQAGLLQEIEGGLASLESASRTTIRQLEEGAFEFGDVKTFLEKLSAEAGVAGGRPREGEETALGRAVAGEALPREALTRGPNWESLYTRMDSLVTQLTTIATKMTERTAIGAPGVSGSGRGK